MGQGGRSAVLDVDVECGMWNVEVIAKHIR